MAETTPPQGTHGGVAPAPASVSRIYCSGPMFSPADHWEMAGIAAALEGAGHTTYLPQRDGLELGPLMNNLRRHLFEVVLEATMLRRLGLWVMQVGFALDVYQLVRRCDSVVFAMNGRVPDEGSVVEASIAFAANKPLVIYKDTPITLLSSGFDSPMVQGLAGTWEYAGSVGAIPAVVAAAEARIAADEPYTYVVPPHLARVCTLGEAVWDAHEILGVLRRLVAGDDLTEDELADLGAWLGDSAELAAAFPHPIA